MKIVILIYASPIIENKSLLSRLVLEILFHECLVSLNCNNLISIDFFIHLTFLKILKFSKKIFLMIRTNRMNLIHLIADLDAKIDFCMMNFQKNINVDQKNGSNMCEPFWLLTVTVILVTLSFI